MYLESQDINSKHHKFIQKHKCCCYHLSTKMQICFVCLILSLYTVQSAIILHGQSFQIFTDSISKIDFLCECTH